MDILLAKQILSNYMDLLLSSFYNGEERAIYTSCHLDPDCQYVPGPLKVPLFVFNK